MIQEDLVTADQEQYFNNPYHTMCEKQKKLCSIILEKPESCVDQFLNCLLKTSDYEPHKKLYDKLYENLKKNPNENLTVQTTAL